MNYPKHKLTIFIWSTYLLYGKTLMNECHIYNQTRFIEDDLRDFETGMSVEDSNGGWGPRGRRKANCCKVLMRKCLELIDVEASSVLACEDIEDLEVTSLRMIVCRETLCIQSETEVLFNTASS